MRETQVIAHIWHEWAEPRRTRHSCALQSFSHCSVGGFVGADLLRRESGIEAESFCRYHAFRVSRSLGRFAGDDIEQAALWTINSRRAIPRSRNLLQAAPAPVSMFVRPNGEQLADAVVGDEGLVVAEIDMPNRPLWIRNPRCRDEQPPDESTQSPQDEGILRSCPQLREAFPYDTQRRCLVFDDDKSSRANSWQEWRPFGPTIHSTFGG